MAAHHNIASTMFSGSGVNQWVRQVAEGAEETMVNLAQKLGSPALRRKSNKSEELDSDASGSSSLTEDMSECPDEVSEATQIAVTEFMDELPNIDLDKLAEMLDLSEDSTENILLIEDRDHYNILHKAIILNNKKLFNMLLNSGCNVNCSSRETCMISSKCRHPHLGITHLACFLGRHAFVSALVERGADIRAKRRVYTSAMLNCPAELQPQVFSSGEPNEVAEWANKCGHREPAYFAVLGDHVSILKFLFSLIRPQKDPEYRNLLPLSCRVGSYKCLEYLLEVYPEGVNRLDGDGMPPLLMAMKHGLKFVNLLLAAGADIRLLQDLWEPGVNVLHFLFRSLPMPDLTSDSLCNVIDACIKRGANINSQGQYSGETPMHVLIKAVNSFNSFDLNHLERNTLNSLDRQVEYEDAVIKTVSHLMSCDCNVDLRDNGGRTPLHMLCNNGRHILRYHLCQTALVRSELKQIIKSKSYGLENITKASGILLKGHKDKSTLNKAPTPILLLIKTILKYEPHKEAQQLPIGLSPSDILSNDDITLSYTRLIQLIGGDVNAHTGDGLPPLLTLWCSLRDQYTLVKVLCTEAVSASMCKLSVVLLDLGAQCECDTKYLHQEKRTIGVFDMLLIILQALQDYANARTASDLRVLKHFVHLFIQYGARTVVYRDLLYGHSADDTIPDAPWCHYLPEHSFLYQVLQFGALNLQYVSQGPYYSELCELLFNEVNQFCMSEVVNSLYVQFMTMHDPNACICKQCPVFTHIIQKYFRRPKTLKQICRNVVLNNIEVLNPEKVKTLELPQQLIQYLLYNGFVS